MRVRIATLVLSMTCVAAVGASVIAPASASTKHKSRAGYYLSLGDSLSVGAQPNPAGTLVPTKHGYANFLYATEKHKLKGLKLKQLGCSGETTTTMINGGICHYAAGSQLNAAVKFIKTHKVAFITIDIGANDVDRCGEKLSGAQLFACVATGVATTKKNLPVIVSALRKAAGRKAKLIGMTYYDPFLADYLGNSSQRAVASESVPLAKSLNGTIAQDYKARHFKVARVDKAFHTYTPWSKTTKLKGHGKVPLAVAEICKYTWMCTPPPRGPSIHAKSVGYKKIAQVFAGVL